MGSQQGSRRPLRVPWVTATVAAFASLLFVVEPAPAGAAQGQGQSNAVCTMVWKSYLSPGFTMRKGTGIYGTGLGITGAETGLISCSGMLNGQQVTGPGTFGHKGKTWDGNCLGNQGSGTYSYTIPTTGGVQHATGTYTESRSINQEGPVEAHQPDASFSGRHQVLPTGAVTSRGSCTDRPVTEVDSVMAGVFRPH